MRKHAAPLFKAWKLKEAYTGALITDQSRVVWMCPSRYPDPCGKFPMGQPVKLNRTPGPAVLRVVQWLSTWGSQDDRVQVARRGGAASVRASV